MGTELENWERDAIYCGQYRIDRQFQSGRKHKYPNYTKQDLKNNKVTGGLALFTGILASAEDSISSVYFKIVFEKDKFRRRVTIYAGSSDIKSYMIPTQMIYHIACIWNIMMIRSLLQLNKKG